MQDHVWVRTHDLIEKYDLHRAYPVNLWPLEDEYLIRMEDMDDTLGAILPPRYGWPAAPDNRARILINNKLPDDAQRIVIAHEIGHGVCQHMGNLTAQQFDMEDRHERQAWEVAAMLLIPSQVVWDEREMQRIADACHVPSWMVEVWRSINV